MPGLTEVRKLVDDMQCVRTGEGARRHSCEIDSDTVRQEIQCVNGASGRIRTVERRHGRVEECIYIY